MKFKPFFDLIIEARKTSEAFSRTGMSGAKERAKDSSPDAKARDRQRKRLARAKEIPNERLPKEELIKKVIAVKTKSGKVQIIFKNNFDKNLHTKITDRDVTMAEANQLANDPKFEQTKASMLIFGDVKKKKGGEEKPKKGGEEEGERKEKREGGEEKETKRAPKKAKKMSKEDMFELMSQMSPEQLATVPPEVRQEYFKMTRKPIENREFDNISDSYEELSVKFGINPSSNIPYNQQVLNAFMFLAKIKSGASEQELQSYNAIAPGAMEFTKSAFAQARKLLSQIGDECIQNLLSSVEMNQNSVDSAGATDMQCGQYRFKISAGGEIALSTSAFDQSNKKFRGYLAGSLQMALQKELVNPSSEKMEMLNQELVKELDPFSDELISINSIQDIMNDEKLLKKLQKTELFDSSGNSLGFVIDENGSLNQYASLENYQKSISKFKKKLVPLVKGDMSKEISSNLLKIVLRGENVVPPELAPNHVVTANGVFPLDDNYINAISDVSDLELKPSKELISSSNIEKYKPAAAAMLKNYRTIVEQSEEEEEKEQPKKSEKKKGNSLFVSKQDIDPISILTSELINGYDFNFNASLLPGFNPKDLNTVKYNYVTIGKKTVKIPVVNDENPTISQLLGESYEMANQALIESMTNNFVLFNLVKYELLTEVEAEIVGSGTVALLESSEAATINLKTILENVIIRMHEDPHAALLFFEETYGHLEEESERDYKKEYRNYHGKAKQRKERAARTRARELMKKKGIVKKGDGKDIDHKKPLRSGGSNGINNLRVRSKSKNRSDNGHKKGEKQNKDWK